MSPGPGISIHSGSNNPGTPGGGALDSIWSPLSPASGVAADTTREKGESQVQESIFDKSPVSTGPNRPSPSAAVLEPSDSGPSDSGEAPRPSATDSQRFLIVQSGGLIIALEAILVREITRFPGPGHFDSGPLSTTVHIHGRNLIFSTLDSLLERQTRQADKGMPIAVIGKQNREAALMVDRILGISDAAENQINGHNLIHPHQKGWLARKDGGRAAIIDLRQILDRILFETNRGKG